MPLYDYSCPSCGNEKEVQHSIAEIGKILVNCDDCNSQMKKQLSAPTLIGFDSVGRSLSKKEKSERTKETKSSSKPKTEAKAKKD